MPSKCCVPGCKGNYYNGPKVPTYKFPNDDLMIKRWITAIRRKDFTPSKYSRVCELHFKKSDFETEASAYDPKTGRTLTAPLMYKRLKKGVIPSIVPSAPLNSSNRESPSEKRRRLEKEQLKQALGKSLKNVRGEKSQSEISVESAADISSSRVSDTAKNEQQGKLPRNKRKLDNTMPHNKKTNNVANSNITHQQSEVESSTDKNKVSNSLNLDAEVIIKKEPPWETGYGVSQGASKHTTENGSLENLHISSVRSISHDNHGETLSSEEENFNKSEEIFDTTFYTKPFSIDEREKAFGNFIACELSDLRENLELYTRTKQCIIKVLTEAHFEQMSTGLSQHARKMEDHGNVNKIGYEGTSVTGNEISASFNAARSRLTEAENTSNIEDEYEDEMDKPLKKVAKTMRLRASTRLSQKQLKTQFVAPLPPPPLNETEQSQSLSESSMQNNPEQFDGEEKTYSLTSLPAQNQVKDTIATESFSWLSTPTIEEQHLLPQTGQENDEIQKLKINQSTILTHVEELMEIVRSNSDKLDLILTKLDCLESNSDEKETEDTRLLSLLPVGIEEFSNFNEKIIGSSSFRRNLIRILLTSGGKDAKAMVANMLRKTISDDVGERYSLTGKQIKNGPTKLPFEKTAVYKVITETCYRVHEGVKETIVREGISEWLMQSKFRKNRREKRKNPEGEVQNLTLEEELSMADLD